MELLTFASVAYQLDQPPGFSVDLWGALVVWTFILMRAFAAPVCAMYLATLGPRTFLTTELYDVFKLTIGATLLAKVEQWQVTGEHTFAEMWQVMTLIDQIARAGTDSEREQLSASLMSSLEGITPTPVLPTLPIPVQDEPSSETTASPDDLPELIRPSWSSDEPGRLPRPDADELDRIVETLGG